MPVVRLHLSKNKESVHVFSIISTAERPYLTWLKEGIKTAEGRVNSPRYQKIHVGDGIKFVDTKHIALFKVRSPLNATIFRSKKC